MQGGIFRVQTPRCDIYGEGLILLIYTFSLHTRLLMRTAYIDFSFNASPDGMYADSCAEFAGNNTKKMRAAEDMARSPEV